MPGRNVVKEYKKNGTYHVYNRGVEKRQIFMEDKDFEIFKRYLDEGLQMHNVKLLNYALLSNHFHLEIRQREERGMEKLMRSLGTRYVLYFNFKYQRVGSLFQGPYRARLLKTEAEIYAVSRYIDEQFQKDSLGETLF